MPIHMAFQSSHSRSRDHKTDFWHSRTSKCEYYNPGHDRALFHYGAGQPVSRTTKITLSHELKKRVSEQTNE